ncbi:hypothetical protein [Dyadobacter bucti]|uniref:hypothetical protein n=1 Tax=Dyadobacter bucti TaxID=2572203 RepID=UPI003F727ABB
MAKYYLEIYRPGTTESAATYKSDSPFGAISKGDYLSRAFLHDDKMRDNYVVKEIQHMIWEAPGKLLTHKICIFTEEVSISEFEKLIGI